MFDQIAAVQIMSQQETSAAGSPWYSRFRARTMPFQAPRRKIPMIVHRLLAAALFATSLPFALAQTATHTPSQTTQTTAQSPSAAQAAKPAGSQAKPSISQKIAADQTKLDLNTANMDQLKQLPGVGDAFAKRIVDGRPYTAKNQLVTKGILPQGTYDKIKEQIVAHRPKK